MLHELVHMEIGEHSDKFYMRLEAVGLFLGNRTVLSPCSVCCVRAFSLNHFIT